MRMTALQARKNIPTEKDLVERELNAIDGFIALSSIAKNHNTSIDYSYQHINGMSQVKAVLDSLKKRGFTVIDNYPGDSMHYDLTVLWTK